MEIRLKLAVSIVGIFFALVLVLVALLVALAYMVADNSIFAETYFAGTSCKSIIFVLVLALPVGIAKALFGE